MSTRRSIRLPQIAGSACMNVFVRARSRGVRPSMRYAARVRGAPAKPITGTGDSRRTARIASRNGATATSGSNGRSRSTSAPDRTGAAMTGPTPSTSSTATPTPGRGVVMSANMIAASTPSRATGWSVTSVHRAASATICWRVARSRILRYSGSDRPAWRMNQTGVASTGSRRQAARKRVARSVMRRTLGVPPQLSCRARHDRAQATGTMPRTVTVGAARPRTASRGRSAQRHRGRRRAPPRR